MRSDIEHLLAGSLGGRAAGGTPVDPAPLLHEATRRGRRRQRRRRLAAAALVALAVIGVSVAGFAVERAPYEHLTPPGPSPSTMATADLGLLPAAEQVPGAAEEPGLVGTDPRVVHLNVDAWAARSWRVTWQSTPEYESANVQRTDLQAYAAVARSRAQLPPPDSFSAVLDSTAQPPTRTTPAPVTVGGVAGEVVHRTSEPDRRGPRPIPGISLWSLVWQPVPGLWATVEVEAPGLPEAVRLAEQVRFDQATRCAVPYRVETVPAGAALRSCLVSLVADDGNVFADGVLTYSDGTHGMQIIGAYVMPGTADYPRPVQAGPHRVDPDPDGISYTMLVKPIHFTLVLQAKAYSRADVLSVLGSVRLVDDVQDPRSYP